MRNLSRDWRSKADTRKLVLWTAPFIVFLVLCWFYFQVRGYPFLQPPPPFSLRDLAGFEFHQFDIGIFLQLVITPVLLMYAVSFIPHYRRLFEDQSGPHATLSVFIGMLILQLVTQSIDVWTYQTMSQPYSIGLFVILIGCLLGGWRVGIPLGVFSMLFQGIYEQFAIFHLVDNIQRAGPENFLRFTDWIRFLYTNFLYPHDSVGLWAAVLACMIADLLGSNRYSPVAAALLGATVSIASGYWRLSAGIEFALFNVPAQALVTGMAAAWVMLMMRNIQTLAARRKAEAAELSRTQAELRALRAQINPHFLFNSLNTIRYMIREDPQRARDLLIDLSEVFQRTLRSGDFVPLRDELSFVEAYLSLEKARLGDRLRVVWGGLLQPEKPLDTDSPLLDQSFPTLALQPLVENAVIHGIGKKIEGGCVTIMLERRDKDLAITIRDDGVGMDSETLAGLLKKDRKPNASIGLRNVDSRLRMLYGPAYHLVIESESGKGTLVAIRMPIGKMERKP